MKTIFYLGVLGFLLSCQEAPPERYVTTAPEIDMAKALVNHYEMGDWENWIQLYADSARIFHNSMQPITKDELKNGFVAGLASYSTYGFKGNPSFYEMIIDDKNEKWVYFWGTWSGTLKTNEEQVYIPVHLALNFKDGKIIREHAYYDNGPIVEAKARAVAMEVDSE
jgi:hypothetical protein